jgi:hypothetical protein
MYCTMHRVVEQLHLFNMTTAAAATTTAVYETREGLAVEAIEWHMDCSDCVRPW